VTDEITLTLPREPEFHRVAHLVLGGLAVRLNLTIENLETIVGPLTADVLDEIEHEGDDGELGLRRVLESTVDDIHVDGAFVRLTKQVTSRG